jgi:hypothetical protein
MGSKTQLLGGHIEISLDKISTTYYIFLENAFEVECNMATQHL